MKILQYFIKLIPFIVAILLLDGCGGGGGSSPTSTPAPKLEVANVSGTTTVLSGTWQTPCYINGTDSARDTMTISADTITTVTNVWSGNTSCTGVAASTYSTTTSNKVQATTGAISDWASIDFVSGTATQASAPNTADGLGQLSITEPFSIIDYTVTATTNGGPSNVGDTGSSAYVVDDTGTSPVLYGVWSDQALGTVGIVNAYYAKPYLSTVDILTMSGMTLNLTGTWASPCIDMGGTGLTYEYSVNADNVLTYTNTAWTDNTCTMTSGSTTITGTAAATKLDTFGMLTGWVDASSNLTPENGTVPYTPISVNVTSATDPNLVGQTVTLFFVVDDTNLAVPQLYEGISGTTTAYNWYFYTQQ